MQSLSNMPSIIFHLLLIPNKDSKVAMGHSKEAQASDNSDSQCVLNLRVSKAEIQLYLKDVEQTEALISTKLE